jgi:hypothetical protein
MCFYLTHRKKHCFGFFRYSELHADAYTRLSNFSFNLTSYNIFISMLPGHLTLEAEASTQSLNIVQKTPIDRTQYPRRTEISVSYINNGQESEGSKTVCFLTDSSAVVYQCQTAQ